MHRLPNILSFIRILLAPLFLVMFIQGDLVIQALGMAVFITAALTDYVDGYLARKYRVESHFGVFLDPLADKFLTFAGFICLPFIDAELYPWWAVIVIMARDILVTGLRMVADRREIVMQTRRSAKFKTATQMVFLYVALLLGIFVEIDHPVFIYSGAIMSSFLMYYAMMGVTALTVWSGLEYMWVNRSVWLPSGLSGK